MSNSTLDILGWLAPLLKDLKTQRVEKDTTYNFDGREVKCRSLGSCMQHKRRSDFG